MNQTWTLISFFALNGEKLIELIAYLLVEAYSADFSNPSCPHLL
jgi:hypothetical protein